MNPYQAAIKKKKFEGLKIELTPINKDEEKMAAREGDGAPDVYDDPSMGGSGDKNDLGDLADQQGTRQDLESAEHEFEHRAQETPGLHNIDPHTIFDDHKAPLGKPKSLRERMLQSLKGKK